MTRLPDPDLLYVRAESLDGCPDVADLVGEPAVQGALCHCFGVQSLETAGDSFQQGLVALSGYTNMRAAGKYACWESVG